MLALNATCTDEQYGSIVNAKGSIHDYILIDANQSYRFPSSGSAGAPRAGGPKESAAGFLGASWGMLGAVIVI